MAAAIDSEFANVTSQSDKQPGRTLIQELLHSTLPESEKTQERIARECTFVTLAGIETTGGFLAATAALLLSHPRKLATLQEELRLTEESLGRKPSYRELKGLAYLVCRTFQVSSIVSKQYAVHSANTAISQQ